jgi:hypothetical protein
MKSKAMRWEHLEFAEGENAYKFLFGIPEEK